jgi:hypothetical protein
MSNLTCPLRLLHLHFLLLEKETMMNKIISGAGTID